MGDLRKAAEMALELLENHVEDPRCEISICKTIKALRQALAQPEQKREWVGLTDAERFYCNEFPMDDCCSDSIIRAEELLKDKNCG